MQNEINLNMNSLEEISEDFIRSHSAIDESIKIYLSIGNSLGNTHKVSNEISENIQNFSKTSNFHIETSETPAEISSSFIQKKINQLKRKNKILASPNHQLPKEILKKLHNNTVKNKEKTSKKIDNFYTQSVDPYLVSKLQFTNKLAAIKQDADPSGLAEENKILSEKSAKIDSKKFISAQYYRLLAKPQFL